jgi:hypothetical protein
MPSLAVDHAIADLKAQFEKVIAEWQKPGSDLSESVHVERAAKAKWLFLLHTSHSVQCRLDPPCSLWLADTRIWTKGPDLCLVGARYSGKNLVVLVEMKHRGTTEDTEDGVLFPEQMNASDLFGDPVRNVAAKRSWRALRRVFLSAAIQDVEDVASQGSDLGVVVRALEQPEVIETLNESDPFAAARLRGVRERERLLLEEGGTWTAEQVAKHLHLTRQTVNLRRKQGILLALDAGRHGFRYPAWQFPRSGVIEGLAEILAALEHVDPWLRQAFMLGKNARLGEKRPVDLLRNGAIAPIVKAASAFGEHGAA